LGRKELEKWLAHRGDMMLVDAVVWHSPDFKQAVGVKHVRNDEFWVAGHFPHKAMFPGVLMIESAAQLAVYTYNARLTEPLKPAFTRIEGASFRSMVVPGDDLFLLSQEVRWSRRGFTCDVQGFVNKRLAFDARVLGVSV